LGRIKHIVVAELQLGIHSGEVMRMLRPGSAVLVFIFLQMCLLAGCSSAVQKYFGSNGSNNEPDAASTTVRNADLSVRSPGANDDPSDRQSGESPKPLLFPGEETELLTPPPRERGSSELRTASLEPVAIRGDDIEINFDGADIPSVAKALLGDVLHLNFVVDPKVQGTVTLASVGSIPRKDVLPTLENVLRMQNVALVRDDKFVKIVPISDASGHSPVSVGVGEPGFGVSVVPLRYISAATVAKTAENMLTRQGAIRVDQSRNLLLIQGTAAEREAALDMVSTFDVEWLRNQSVGVYPLKSTSPETMIEELQRVFETSEGGAGQGVVRFQPISRMNAVMVVTKNPNLLNQTTQWVERLDRSDNSGTAVRSYRLKYGNAAQIVKVLNGIFASSRSGSDGDAPHTSPTAPGTTTAQSRLDSLSSTQNSATSGTPAGSATGQPGGSFSSGSSAGAPISAAFKSFSNHGDADGGSASNGAPSGGGSQRGIFENIRITADTINNAVVIYSNQEDYRIIERAVRDFDRPRLQVAIEATVAEVTLTKELTYGVQYYFNGKQGSIGLTNAVTAAAGTTSAGATVLQQTFPGFNAVLGSAASPKVILNALNSITDVKVLSSPSIVVLDNQPALLEVGDEIPITTSSATLLNAATTPTVNTISMVPTGVILKVLPHVNANGSIELEVDQEVSAVVNPSQQTLTPTISERHVHSTVAVNSGQTVLLGGLISDNDQKVNGSLPGLGDINVIGKFLGNTDNTKTRTEIIIFIRPQLIRDGVSARAVTQEFRDRLTSMKNNANSIVSGADVRR
jgi:general secretion pathway protein D